MSILEKGMPQMLAGIDTQRSSSRDAACGTDEEGVSQVKGHFWGSCPVSTHHLTWSFCLCCEFALQISLMNDRNGN